MFFIEYLVILQEPVDLIRMIQFDHLTDTFIIGTQVVNNHIIRIDLRRNKFIFRTRALETISFIMSQEAFQILVISRVLCQEAGFQSIGKLSQVEIKTNLSVDRPSSCFLITITKYHIDRIP